MQNVLHSIFTVLIVLIGLQFTVAEDCKGCVPLDSSSFDKVIAKFKVAAVKFDVAFPYGEKHEEYGKVAEATKNSYDILIAEVGIKDFGNKDNTDLADRFNIKKEEYPAILLFIHGKKEPYKFVTETDDQFTSENIKRFIKSKSGIYIGLPGCIEKLDKLAEQFKSAKEKDRQEILSKAKIYEETLSEAQRAAAKVYIKTMERIMDRGNVFVQTEQTRLDGLLKGKLSKEKKRSMEERKNILQSFSHKDEL